MEHKNNATKVITGEVRFSYLNVFEPKSINDSEAKYSVSLLIPKTDTKTIDAVNRAVLSCYWAKSWWKVNLCLFYRDGSGAVPTGSICTGAEGPD